MQVAVVMTRGRRKFSQGRDLHPRDLVRRRGRSRCYSRCLMSNHCSVFSREDTASVPYWFARLPAVHFSIRSISWILHLCSPRTISEQVITLFTDDISRNLRGYNVLSHFW